jgi:hypothetical protein
VLLPFSRIRRPATTIAIVAFGFALVSGCLIQFIVLPILLPGLHAGDGLLLASDSVGFHRLAVTLASQMHAEGWSTWELRPRGQAPAGIAAIFYSFSVPRPFVLLPLNAALFALAAVLVYAVVRQVVTDASAFYAGLLFIATPSSAMWYSQIHKEMFFVPGILLQVWIWLFLMRKQENHQEEARDYGRIVVVLSAAVLSSTLIWMVRPYFLSIMALSNLLVAIYIVIALRRFTPGRRFVHFALAVLLVLVPVVIKQAGQMSGVSFTSAKFMREDSLVEQPLWPARSTEGPVTVLDSFVRTLNISRDSFEGLGGGSNLFGEVRFGSIGDVVVFAPTALAVSVLAPFPDAWFASARQPGGQMMRTVAAFEMLFGYFGLGFLFVRLVQGGLPSRLVGIVVAFCVVPLLIWGLAIPNVGTLYRFRAPLWTLLVLLGWAFAFQWLAARQLHRDR